MSISLDDALSDWVIREYRGTAISKRRLCEQVFYFYKKKVYGEEQISNIRMKSPGNREYSRCITRLEESGVISPDKSNKNKVDSEFYIINSTGKESPIGMIFSIFPYGYLSYISAMSWYGITDRIPKKIYLTAPSRDQWKERSIDEISKRIGSSSMAESFIPIYPSSGFIFGKEVSLSTTKNMIEPKEADGGVRIQDIGDLFIDMLRHPEKCGGESHVVDVFMEYATTFKRKIINRTDSIGTSIDKARVGFILNEILGIKSESIEGWKEEKANQRGGSRKLFPSLDFSSVYNKNWNISINIKELEKYGKTSS